MFQRLSTRLTLLYAALFGVVLLMVSVAVFLAISQAVARQVRAELAATGTVFDRVWSLRSERLREGASLLSRDFGFRAAAATGDVPTIESALQNLRQRMGADLAFMVDAEGRVIGAPFSPADLRELGRAFDVAGDPSGVFMLGNEPYQLVSAPVLSPELIGRVVFAVRLDRREMRALERLSAIPLEAVVLHRAANGAWTSPSAGPELAAPAVSRFIDRALGAGAGPQVLELKDTRAVALVKQLPTAGAQGRAVLLLRYPLALALRPYRPLLIIVGLLGLWGLAVVSWGSWLLARGVTRPISELAAAAHRLQRGEDAQVSVASADEIGRLAMSFNSMSAEIRKRERRITQLALHDNDTGLRNRLALERAVNGLTGWQGQVYVAAIRMDRFNHMRGAIGHQLAAQAMRMVGRRLGGQAPTCGVARLSTAVLGFVVIAGDDAAAIADVQRLLDVLDEPVQVSGELIDVALSVGLAPLGGGGAGPAIERAMIALDQARAARRKISVFDAEAYGDPAANLSLMSSLLKGIEAGELVLWHQPKYDLREHAVTGVEALVRWNHPSRGLLSPDVFIPMAEETGHVRALTEWVVTQAVADQRALAEAGHRLDVAVNISGRILGEPDFADFAEAAIRQAAGRICFEITETAVIENPDVALQMLDRFSEMGVSISLDDFGTGLSSLAYLKRIRGDELKIDRSVVRDINVSQRDALIVRSTIDLAHSLGLKVVAEGVETRADISLLAAMGCDQAQGYAIGKPQPLSRLLEFLGTDAAELRTHG